MPEIRASDHERERTVEALRRHAAAGRLDAEELEERVGLALAARTRGQLERLMEDLPAAPAPRPRPARAHACRTRTGGPPPVVPIAVLLIAIWALTGGGYFWPIWPLLWLAFATMSHRCAGNRRVIGNRQRTGNTARTW